VPLRDPTDWMEDLSIWLSEEEIEGTAANLEAELLFRGSKAAATAWLSFIGIAAGAFAAVTFSAGIGDSVVAFGTYLLVAVVLLGGLRRATIHLVGRPMVSYAAFGFLWAALLAGAASLAAAIGSSWLAYGVGLGAAIVIGAIAGRVVPAVVRREDAWMGASLGMAASGIVMAALVYRNWLGDVDPLIADITLGTIAGGPFSIAMAALLFGLWDQAHGMRNMAVFLLHNDDLAPRAVTYLDNALAYSPTNAELYTLRGIAWSKMEQPARAAADWQRASELRPDYPHPHMNLGLDHLRRGHTGEALEALGRALALAGDDAAVHNNLGTALACAGERDRARHHFDQAIALKPDYANAYAGRANARLQSGDYEGAIGDCNLAVKHGIRGHPKALVIRGHALAALGRCDEAVASYESAIHAGPRPEIHREALRGLEARMRPADRAAE
jgi:Tfp pilus assembly protein PilF